MADDELNAPLGQNVKKKRRSIRLPIALPQAGAGLLGLFVLTWSGWALFVSDPLGGEPMAVVATDAGSTKPQRLATNGPGGAAQQGPRSYDGPTGVPAAKPAESAASPVPASAAKTVTIIDGSTGKRQEVPIPTIRDARAPVDQRLLENTPNGAIPRIASDGVRPAEAYSRPVRPLPNKKDGPRIAIVVGGLGISAAVTQQAIAKLPAAVTLAFPPYGTQVDVDATGARAEGHEVLLQAAMEPFDYPDNDPGPQTLLTSLTAAQNNDRLHWQMSRLHGYVGIASYMGARFLSSEQAMAPVLKDITQRGLIFVDDGSSTRSTAGQIAGANNVPFARADVRVDAVPTAPNIDRALSRLEAMARERGSAVGFASALPSTIERIALWAKAAEGRGILLVPISAIAIRPKSS